MEPVVRENRREKALLVGIFSPPEVSRVLAEEYLAELSFLADTAGADVVDRFLQERPFPDPAYCIGKGKVEEIVPLIAAEAIDLVIFDDDLTPAQARNLERALACKVIDRTGLILQIFAIRAQSAQAKMQVELAQLEYMLPRLSGKWTHLSKQKGGIGNKGPGETQIETDRRLVRNRIALLKKKLHALSLQHSVQTRSRLHVQRISLVGYTNAGKSTLMNALCPEADAFAENRLFATLDTKTRRLELELNKLVLLSDTVGFIRKLPHTLVESFKSTLDEVLQADFLLHVIDVSHPQFEEQIAVVRDTLKEIGVMHDQIIDVFNKIDQLQEPRQLRELQSRYPAAVFISAMRGINIPALKESISHHLAREYSEKTVRIHVADYRMIGYLYDHAEVLVCKYIDDVAEVTFRARAASMQNIEAALQSSSVHPV